MAKRIFISFAMEDQFARNNLSYQVKQANTPFDFIDMSVKSPWDNNWKTNCRSRIKSCDGMIALLSSNTLKADGARWEIKCAIEEGIPLIGVYIYDYGCTVPYEMLGKRVVQWTWPNITYFVNSL